MLTTQNIKYTDVLNAFIHFQDTKNNYNVDSFMAYTGLR